MKLSEIEFQLNPIDLRRLQSLYRQYEDARYAFEVERNRQRLRLYRRLQSEKPRRGHLPPKPERPDPPRRDWPL